MEEQSWRLLDLKFEDPRLNMAVEEAIPRKVGDGVVPNTIRFWRNRNAVVVGRFQSVALEVNLKECKTYGTKIVRRFTGGGAVYHDYGNLNYAISIRNSAPSVRSCAFEAFKVLSKGVIEGLGSLGVSAEYKTINCVEVGGRKVSGAAGSIRWGTVFYHGSILVSSDLDTLSKVLNTREKRFKSRYVRSVQKRVTTLRAELGRDVSISEIKEALGRGFELTYKIRLFEGELTREEEELAGILYRKKYSKDEWNLHARNSTL